MSFTLKADDVALYDLNLPKVVDLAFAGGSSARELEQRFGVAGDTLLLAPLPPRRR